MPGRVAVVGGGVAGLSITYEILQRSGERAGGPDTDVVCLEAEDRPGGNVRTDLVEGFVTEWGPNGFLDNVPATLELARRLGLEERLLPAAPSAADRFIFRGGRLRKLPMGPLSFLVSDVLSLRGRLRVLGEPFGPRAPQGGDESVFDFARRRIGTEAARVLVAAMVTGIYAGDAKKLSLRSTFPKMFQMEREFGTLTRALLAKRKAARAQGTRAGGPAGPGGKLTSFRGGLGELIHALAQAIGPSLRTGARVIAIAPLAGGGYRLTLERGDPVEAASVVLACPAWHAAEATARLDPELSTALAEIPSAPLIVLHLGFEESDLPGGARGFGFLVPRGEGLRILGTIWASSIFPGRAPSRKALLTTMIGGAHDPEAIGLSDASLLDIGRRDLRAAMGIEKPPPFVRLYRHPRGIPQYTLGHSDRLARAERRLESLPGLFIAGNSYRGISVNSCADEAPRIAAQVVSFLGETPRVT